MTTTHDASPLARPLSHILKPALAMLAAFLVGGARGDWLWWDNGGSDTTFTTPENWSTDIFPGTGNVAAFEGDSTGKTIVFAAEGTQVGDVFVRNNWWNSETLSPVVFSASDSANGFASLGVFSCADIGGATYGCRSALTIQSGTYTAANTSYWGWGANAGLSMVIDGESRVVLNSGLNMMYGGFEDTANNIPWSNIGNVTNKIDIKSGALVVNGGNVLIGTNSDWSKTTINVGDADGNGATTGEFSVGSATTHSLKLSEYGCTGTTVEININKGGNLKAYNIIDGGGTGDPELSVVFNGGTLVALGVGDTSLVGEGITVVAGSNGGIIDAGANNVTIAAPVTGAGTITKKGTGTLTLSGDMSGFTGVIQVKDGSVVVPSASSSIAAGPSTLKTVTDNTTVFTSVLATAFEFDFEDSSMSGWTAKEYNEGAKGSSSIGSRNLVVANKKGKTTSNFYRYQSADGGSGDRGATITYNLSADTSALSDYTLEMDWFAVQNGKYLQQSSHDVGLTLSSASGAVAAVLANPDSAVTGNNAGVYLNGATTASGTIATAAPYGDCTGDTNQQYWYHAILKASETDGVTFTILKNDGTVAFSETRVCDYIKITQIKLDAHRVRVSNTSKGGIDDVVISVPAKAMFCGIGYKTLQDAVNVAAASSETTKTVTLLDNVTENITLSTPGTVVNLGAFVITGTVSAGSGMVVGYDDATKSWTCEADISTYTWTNAKGNNSWQDPENWMAGSTTATVAPSADTTVVFPSAVNAWPVELTEKGYAKQIQANGDVVLTGALIALNDTAENGIVGTGKVTLGNNSGFEVTTGTLTIVNSVEITAAAAHQAQIAMDNYENLYLKGNLTGSGTIRLGADRSRIYLSGNNTGFAGSFITVNSPNDRSHVVFANAQATSSSAAWTINSGIEKTGTSWNIVDSYGQTYTFGELTGKFHNDTAAGRSTSKFEVGALNTDFAFTYYGVNNSSNDRYDSFRKVGSGKMEITGTYVRHYELVGGIVKLMTDASLPVRDTADAGIRFDGGTLQLAEAFTVDPSAKFVFIASKTAVFDDEGIPRTFEAAIGNSVAANFTKKGAGALTLEAVPTYTGTTKVEAGALYVVEGGEWAPTLSATVEVNTDREGYRKFIPLKPSGVIFLIF